MLSAIRLSPLLATQIPMRKADTVIKGNQTASVLNKINNNKNNSKKSQNLGNNHFMIFIHHVLPSWYSHPSHLCHSVFLPGSSQRSRRVMSCKHNLGVAITTFDIWNDIGIGNISWPAKRTKTARLSKQSIAFTGERRLLRWWYKSVLLYLEAAERYELLLPCG